MPKIFVSYRREDSPGYAGRLYDRLHHEFGPENLFIDVDTLHPGDDFVDAIGRMLTECDVVLAVIGPRWLTVEDEQHRPRIHDELDFVRLEIQTALERKIRVVPVLVEQARMPKREDLPVELQPLVRRQAIELSDTRWMYDVTRLVQVLRSPPATSRGAAVGVSRSSSPPEVTAPSSALEPQSGRDQIPVGSDPRGPDISSQSSQSVNLSNLAISQRLLAQIDYKKWVSDSLVVSPDNRHFAFVERARGFLGLGSRSAVVSDKGTSQEYDSICTKLVYSPNNSRLAYGVQVGNKYAVVVDGQEGPRYDNLLIESLTFSTDGQNLAYGALSNGKWVVVTDGEEGSAYDALTSDLVFSPDGRRLAYIARSGDKWVVVLNGREGKPCENFFSRGLLFSPDGQHFAYGAFVNGKWTAVLDGREGQRYDGLASDFVFSADSRHLAYSALNGDKWLVNLDGKETKRYDGLLNGRPILSADGLHLVYGAFRNGKWMAVVDGEEGQPYDGILATGLLASPDSQHIAYGARTGGAWSMVVNGREGKHYESLVDFPFAFSPDSQHIAYGAVSDDKQLVVIDGEEDRPYDGLLKSGLLFSPDSRHLSYGALTNGKWIVVLDGQAGSVYDGLSGDDFVFSPDGQHFAYAAKNGSEWMAVIDGREAPLHGGIVKGGRITFESRDKLHLLAVSGEKIYLVNVGV